MKLIIWTIVWGCLFSLQAMAQDEVSECEFDNSSASSATSTTDLESEAKSSTSASLVHPQLGASTTNTAPSSGSTFITRISSALSTSSVQSISTSSPSPSRSTPVVKIPSAPSISSTSSTLIISSSSSSSTAAASPSSAVSIYHPLSDCPTGVGYDPTPGILAIGYPAHGQNIPVTQPFNITWTELFDIANVAIVLCHGPPENCVSIDCIIPNIKNTGSYFWTPRSTLKAQDGQGYGIKIIAIGGKRNGEFQFSPQFGISNPLPQSSYPQ